MKLLRKSFSINDWRMIAAALAVAHVKKNNGLMLTDDQRVRCGEMAREIVKDTGKER